MAGVAADEMDERNVRVAVRRTSVERGGVKKILLILHSPRVRTEQENDIFHGTASGDMDRNLQVVDPGRSFSAEVMLSFSL